MAEVLIEGFIVSRNVFACATTCVLAPLCQKLFGRSVHKQTNFKLMSAATRIRKAQVLKVY